MHPNPTFRQTGVAENIAFARARGFGTLVISTNAAPLMSHVPFLLSEDGASLDLHLVRSNPIARALTSPQPARIAVQGPDSYISPDWYDLPDQVPTWNYVAVHLTGTLELRPQDELLDLLDRLSHHFEQHLAPKPIWSSDKMDASALQKMLRQIVPCRMAVSDVQGTWKLAQNKPAEARQSAADHLEQGGVGAELATLATMMRDQ